MCCQDSDQVTFNEFYVKFEKKYTLGLGITILN